MTNEQLYLAAFIAIVIVLTIMDRESPGSGKLVFVLMVLASAGWYFYQSRNERELGRAQQAVKFAVVYTTRECPEALPLLITIHNGSHRRIANFNWVISAYFPGKSSNQTNSYPGGKSDRMLDPGQTYSFCMPQPSVKEKNPDSLRWSIARGVIGFAGD